MVVEVGEDVGKRFTKIRFTDVAFSFFMFSQNVLLANDFQKNCWRIEGC